MLKRHDVSYEQLNGPFDEFILAALSRFEVFLLREDAIWLCPQNPILEAEADDFSGRYSTEVIVGGGSKARPVQPSSTQPKAEQRYAAEAQHGVGQSSRRSEAHQPPCNSMNPWGTGTFAYCSLCGSLVSSLAHVAPCGLQSQISGIQIESSPTYAA
ncbi:hypothetical protein HZ326_5748 [Fusarium oxysporum f. sp. albedinis]|nr:hypothetical protein HZ326_5748 [Fusarium oxysporum f. sp. albedinis]